MKKQAKKIQTGHRINKLTGFLWRFFERGFAPMTGNPWMLVLIFLFKASFLMAQSQEASIGALPVPEKGHTAEFLTSEQHGVLLENDQISLVWEKNGNLALYFYGEEVLWSTDTGGKGSILTFVENEGRLAIKDSQGYMVWSSGGTGGRLLKLQADRNLVMLSSGGRKIWQTKTTIKYLNRNNKQRIEALGHYAQDFAVPANPGYKYLYLRAEGADGGKRQIKFGGKRYTTNGGSGATIKGIFPIGTGKYMIPPRSVLRFIVGFKGDTRTGGTMAGSGGGGGTAVLVKKPGNVNWHLLMVAGGGGGAYRDWWTVRKEGKSARTGENGSKGGCDRGRFGGKNGGPGSPRDEGDDGSSGGGAYDSEFDDGAPGEPGWSGGRGHPEVLPRGGMGKVGGVGGWSKTGRWGFGGGGSSGKSGGGGGGYSGGGAGVMYCEGGGGGSYFNSDFAVDSLKVSNERTSDSQNGFVEYQFTNLKTMWTSFSSENDPKKCMEVDGQSTGANIHLGDCDEEVNQRWYFANDKITRASASDKCLDLAFNKTSNDTNIRLWNCNNSNAQRWVYDGVSKQIRNRGKWNKCLDYENTGGNIRIWDCLDIPGQKWKIEGAHAMAGEGSSVLKTIHLARAPHKCLELFGDNRNNSTKTQLWNCKDRDQQKWLFDGITIRYYPQLNKCLDLDHSNTKNGTNSQIYDCNGTGAQHWIYDGITGTIRYWDNLDKCLVVRGTFSVIHDCENSPNREWKLIDADVPFGPDKVKTIRLAVDQNRCLVIAGESATVRRGANIQQWICKTSDKVHQQWIFDGLYFRSKADSTKCLDLKNGDTKNETNIQLWTCNGNKAQRWFYDKEAQVIRYADNWNKCLDVKKGRTYEPANVRIFDCDGGVAQRWVMRDEKQ